MKNLSILILFVALLTGCGQSVSFKDCKFPWLREKEYTRCDDGVVFERFMYHVQHLAIKYREVSNLNLEDSNIWYGDSIEKIRLDFSSMALVEFCDARALLVDLVDDLLKNMEEDQLLMNRLDLATLDPNIFEVYIDFKSWFGKKVDLRYVGWVSLENGCANYYAFDMRTHDLDWWHRRSETFVESRAIVYAMRQAEADWKEANKADPELLEEDRFRLRL